MGIENRDYYRESSYTDRLSGWSIDAIPPVCKWLIIINVAVFVGQIFVTRGPNQADREKVGEQYKRQLEEATRYYRQHSKELPEQLSDEQLADEQLEAMVGPLPRVSIVQEWLQLETPKVIRGQVWRLLTCAFCHDRYGIWHIVFNMLALYWFGPTLEAMYGQKEFLLFYLTAAIVSSLAYVGLDLATGGATPAIGASGAVMAVFMLFAIFYPRHTIRVMFFLPIEVRWLVIIYVIFDLHPVLLALAGDRGYSGIAHAAHLGGLAFGFIYWKLNLRLEPYLDFFRTLRRPGLGRTFGPRRNFRLFRPSPEEKEGNLDSQVDEILRKIHEEGEESLTERERQTLSAASKKYRRKNR